MWAKVHLKGKSQWQWRKKGRDRASGWGWKWTLGLQSLRWHFLGRKTRLFKNKITFLSFYKSLRRLYFKLLPKLNHFLSARQLIHILLKAFLLFIFFQEVDFRATVHLRHRTTKMRRICVVSKGWIQFPVGFVNWLSWWVWGHWAEHHPTLSWPWWRSADKALWS